MASNTSLAGLMILNFVIIWVSILNQLLRFVFIVRFPLSHSTDIDGEGPSSFKQVLQVT